MNNNRNPRTIRSAAVLLLAMATSGCLGGYRSNEDSDSSAGGGGEPSGYYGPASSGEPAEEGGQQAGRGQLQAQQAAALQQAPSQQRGVPTQQHYFNEDDQGSAPSNNKHTQDYQMGAYLGPSMDDKEINGAFNSNDERDDDDGPAGYDGPSSAPAMGRGRAAASQNTYQNNNGYGASAGYGRPAAAGFGAPGSYDEDGADEDEAPAPRARQHLGRGATGYGRSGLSQAASQYQQRGSSGQPGASGQSLMAAANGYSPYGYGTGPVDLNGLMAGLSGDPSGQQVYQGDGSYPGASYYQQQAQGGRQRPAGRAGNQANSLGNGYYNRNEQDNGFNDPPASRGRQAASNSNNYNEDRDNDNDDD